jgi:hypothetical protein
MLNNFHRWQNLTPAQREEFRARFLARHRREFGANPGTPRAPAP